MALERTRQQRTPANFGAGATSLSQVDTSSANFVRQGVVDNSSLAGLDTATNIARGVGQAGVAAIELGKQVHEGFQLADFESQLEKNIQDFVESRNNPQIADEAALDASTLSRVSEGLWARLGEGASIEDIDAVEKDYQQTLSRYQKAVNQGVMSSSEFMTKSLAITREAINKNPSLYDSILQHGKKVMGLSGVESLMKAEEAAMQDQQKIMEQRITSNRNYLIQNNIMPRYLSDGSYDVVSNEAKANEISQEQFLADAVKRQGNIRNEAEAAQAAQFMSSFGVQAVNGLVNDVNKSVVNMLNDPNSKGDVMPIARAAFSQLQQAITQRAGPLMHKDGVRQTLDYAEKTIQTKLDMLEKMTNREDLANWLKTEEEIQRNSEMVNIRKAIPLESVKLSSQLLQSIGGAALLSKDHALFTNTTKTLTNVLTGVQNGYDTDYGALSGDGKNAVSEAVKSLADLTVKGQDSARDGLNKIVDTIYADTRINNKFENVADRYAFYDSYIQSLSKKGIEQLGETQRGKASENLEDYMRITMSNFNKDIADVQNRGVEVQMNTLPDGRINIRTSNQAETDLLVNKYQVRINNALRAFAGLSGSNTERVADEFYNQYEPIKGLSKLNFGKREDGSDKGNGFLGVLQRPDGGVSTELSIGVNIDGKDMDIPMLVPSLTKKETDHLLNDGEPTDAIVNKAVAHAKQRLKQGKSVFADDTQGKPNATNPLNLTIPGKQGQFQSFPTTDDGIRAASAQLDRYFQGKTTGKPLQTVSQIVGTWNNENEKGSMSKKDYVATVMQYSGLKANEKLDLTDPYVKADLMFGMSKAEGRGLRYSQILGALGLK